MRAGGCTVQQALTAEAAAVVKQALSLARRRGNAQVTPLHVASAMMQAAPPSTGLLRAACLRSHSHPLQCKALELCFNVALNRLPASAGASPLLGHGHGHVVYYPPSLSNALVAAFKRAQAHQRRGGSVEAQQQPVLAVKIELEQLVISILDDPSVSRVMREAGFSSTQVKANVEQAAASVEANNNPCSAAQNPNPSAAATTSPVQETKPCKLKLPLDQVRDVDVAAILDCLATRSKKRIMVVAECAAAAEAAARAAVDKIKRGEARHESLRSAQVVTMSVSMFRDAPRDVAERRLAELRCVVKAGIGRAAVVLVVEDLAWAAEFWAGRRAPAASSGRYYYCAVEHAVAEVRALACRGGGDGVWLVGHGTYQTNMRCRAGHPSLESLWGLQTLAVPAGSLALSLNCADADADSAMAVNHLSTKAKCDGSGNGSTLSPCLSLLDGGGGSGQLPTYCGDCSAGMFDGGATKALPQSVAPPSSTPPWLHHCHDEDPRRNGKKWISSGRGGSPSHRTALNFSAVVSPSSSDVSSYEQYYQLHQPYQPWLVAGADKHPWRSKCRGDGAKLASAKEVKSHDSSASSGSVEVERRAKFKELSAENLKLLCGALEKAAPWQKDIVPEIASTVLRCRSGMAKSSRADGGAKEETWMFFLGGDADGKAKVARELASLVFGSPKSFVSIGATASSTSPARPDSTEQQHRSKRPRPDYLIERLYDAVRDNPHRVILMEDVERADRRCQLGIREAIESGVVRSHSGGGEAVLADAIVVLSCDCESFDAWSRACCSPPTTSSTTKKAKTETGDQELNGTTASSSSTSCFDLNMSAEDDDEAAGCCFDGDAGLIKAVDRALFFRPPVEL